MREVALSEGSATALRGSAARTEAPQADRDAAESPTASGRVEFCTERVDAER